MKLSEVDVLKAVDDALAGLEDGSACDRVLRWAWEKYSSKPVPSAQDDSSPPKEHTKKGASMKKTNSKKAKGKTTPAMVKDLNLKPKGKKSFDDFANEKKPGSNKEKCTVAVYYLRNELEHSKISASHVFTCFKHLMWRVPANLPNTLQVTASVQGWLDTGNMEEIKVTTIGENLVEHDLPRGPKTSKKH